MKKSIQEMERRTCGRGTGQSAAASVDVTLQNVNDAPVARGQFGEAANDAEGRMLA